MKLWLLWVLASAVAFGFGGRLGRAVSPSADLIVIGYLSLAASLILVGVLQSLILRPLISDAAWWVLASLGAVATIGVLAFGVGMLNRDVGWVLGVVTGWLVLGVLQWLVLRENVAGAGWWVMASVLSLVVAGPVVGFLTWLSGAAVDTAMGGLLRWLGFGAAYGGVTGAMLWWLLQEKLRLAAA